MRPLRIASLISLVVTSLACGVPSLPRPPLAAHVTADLARVPSPPPPAKVEIVPPRPSGPAVWIDGEWTLPGRRWRWRCGRWVDLPANARFAPWTQTRGPDGQLYFAPGKWVDASGAEVPAPRVLLEAAPSTAIVVNEYGEEEDIGRDLTEELARARAARGDGGRR